MYVFFWLGLHPSSSTAILLGIIFNTFFSAHSLTKFICFKNDFSLYSIYLHVKMYNVVSQERKRQKTADNLVQAWKYFHCLLWKTRLDPWHRRRIGVLNLYLILLLPIYLRYMSRVIRFFSLRSRSTAAADEHVSCSLLKTKRILNARLLAEEDIWENIWEV